MSRHLLTLWNEADRKRAWRYISQAPDGTRLELKAAKRTLPQNDMMWSLLTDIAAQKEHGGRKYAPDVWKLIFLHAIGREIQFVPSLDEKAFIPWTPHSSDLSRTEMSQLIDFITAWGAENEIMFHAYSQEVA